MKAKLGDTIVNYWQISTEKPENEPWVLEAFEHEQLSWSGKLVMELAQRVKLRKEGMAAKPSTVTYDEDKTNVENLITNPATSWLFLYTAPDNFTKAYPYNIYLFVNQARVPAVGQIGEYLVLSPLGVLEVYSEKKFKRDLKIEK
ncbi:hypothetical protein [Lactococcus kimchii]|uniref:hypothetical protein n=1 Tax=Lactococcus sp. S-13 TaxID=2507158 RepID=UPI001023C4C1|nr:hypothetical protein [Lactococcus sp. S-13]RZI49333.1 hypothetical protein EQJ87_07710 [Lactococcus sp. S-13]